MNKYQKKHINLIESCNGIVVDNLFVEKVGVILSKKSSITNQAQKIFENLNIDINLPPSQQSAEFNSRLTYLSFRDEKSSSSEYLDKMIMELGHRSIYNDEMVTFIIAGCGIETMIEFMAHNEATIARLTSSKTRSQDEPLYRIYRENFSEDFIKKQKKMILDFMTNKKLSISDFNDLKENEKEVVNIMSPGSKAVSFTISMSIKDWHKTFIGRFSHHGVELEMIEILKDVHSILEDEYPSFFNTQEEYFNMNNSRKYS